MSEQEWIKVYKTDQLHRAMIVQSVLKEHNIDSVLLNQKDSTHLAYGEISVMVNLAQASDAMIIIEKEIS